MAAPALKDCPKVAIDLKSQLEGFSTDNLKNTDTCEKIILPSAEGIYNNFFLINYVKGHKEFDLKRQIITYGIV